MTARDALAEQERNARAALVSAIERLVAEGKEALFDARIGRTVSVNVLNHRVAAVKDWQEIAQALPSCGGALMAPDGLSQPEGEQ